MQEEPDDFQQSCSGEEIEGYKSLVLSDLIPIDSRIGTAVRTKCLFSAKEFLSTNVPHDILDEAHPALSSASCSWEIYQI